MATWSKIITTEDDANYKNNNDVMQFYGKIYIRGNTSGRQIWNTPSTAFGPNYHYWSSYFTTNNNIGKTSWNQDYHPGIVIPWDSRIVSSNLLFNATNAGTYRYELYSGTPTLTNTLATLLYVHGTGMTQYCSASKYYSFTEDYSPAAQLNTLAKGDIMIPQFSRTSSLTNASTFFLEATLTLEFERI